MGYIRHSAIVVSSCSEEKLAIAHEKAIECCGNLVSNIVPYRVNGGGSFFVAPDGSKEGWAVSDTAALERDRFVGWLDWQRHEDNSTPFDWFEAEFGSDDRSAVIGAHAWERPIK